DRVTVLVEGQAAATGPPAQIWSEPRTVDVARIVGHNGIVTATVTNGVAAVDGLQIPISAPEGTATLLIRPGAARIGGSVVATVISSRYRGPDWVATVALGGGSVEVSSPEPVSDGQTINVGIDPAGVTTLE
ncbi:MAG: TOBE domain-containing protein, partial [Acidimicrobiia bacterium]